MAKPRIVRIQGHLIDLGTSNKSFLQVAKDLKSFGIKNWWFMLEIFDPSLVSIDPYAINKLTGEPNLSKDQVARITYEIVRNPWYYLREISRIPDQGGVSIPYKANRGNIAQAWCFVHGVDSWLNLPRQQGKTQSALAIEGWSYNFATSNSEIIFVNKSGEDCKANLLRLKNQLELLPKYLQYESYIDEETGKRVKAQKNATRMRHAINKNSIKLTAKATSYENALSLARGLTAPIIHYDEIEFTNHCLTIVDNSVSTYMQAAENAKKNGGIYGRIFTSTPGDLDSNAGQESQQLLNNTLPWSEKMYDYGPDWIKEAIKARGEKCNSIVYIEYSYRQIGRSDEWFRQVASKITDPLVVITLFLLLMGQ